MEQADGENSSKDISSIHGNLKCARYLMRAKERFTNASARASHATQPAHKRDKTKTSKKHARNTERETGHT